MKQQKIFVLTLFTGVFIALILLGNEINHHSISQAQTQPPTKQSPVPHIVDCNDSPLNDLDKFIQRRFQERDVSFGISRVLPSTYHQRENARFAAVHFAPRNDEELLTTNALRDEGWKVGLFLVGRGILDKKPKKELWDDPNNEYYARKPINNPILITPQTKVEELPPAYELWDESQKAMKSFSRDKEQYTFTAGQWQMLARPIRATQQACLQCHQGNTSPNVYGRLRLISDERLTAKKAEESSPVNPLKIGDPLGVALYVYKQKAR